MNECIFCKIVSGEFSTEIIGETDHSIAFRDINPEMSVHVLVVPKRHFRDVTDLVSNDEEGLIDLVKLGNLIAKEHTSDGSFKLLFNTGANAGQSVFHAHGHVLSSMPKSA
jgi:histidine triad (HIT) family protein